MSPIRTVALLSLLAPAAAAAAQDAAPVTRVSVERRAAATFARADVNHDGYLSKDEYNAVITAIVTTKGGKPTEQGLAAADAQFDAIDTAHTGRIARPVFIAAAVAHFDGADLNGDGTVTPDEARAAAKQKQKSLDDAKKADKSGG